MNNHVDTDFLKNLIANKGHTQRSLACKIGISIGTMRNIILNYNSPALSIVNEVAAELNMTPEEIIKAFFSRSEKNGES